MNNLFLDSLIETMQQKVALHKLELMQRYPNDLLVHDRGMLAFTSTLGTRYGWVVGDSHTHLAVIGLHPEENSMLTALTHLASNDQFYFIDILKDEVNGFKMTHVSREDFIKPASEPCRYDRAGDNWSFVVKNQDTVIGRVEIDVEGSYTHERKFSCDVYPVENISAVDASALRLWANKGVTKAAGTLFCKYDVVWHDHEVKQKKAA